MARANITQIKVLSGLEVVGSAVQPLSSPVRHRLLKVGRTISGPSQICTETAILRSFFHNQRK